MRHCASHSIKVYSGTNRQFELQDLQPASRIAFRVCAVNSAGAGSWSPVGSCVMPAARPDQPTGLALDPSPFPHTTIAGSQAEVCVGGVSMTTAQIVWIAPTDNGCPITGTPFSDLVFVMVELDLSQPTLGHSNGRHENQCSGVLI